MTKYISTFCFCALLLTFSCTDPNLIGLEVQPPSDGISVELTSANHNLKLSTISEDSLRSDEPSNLVLGAMNDPIFGYNRGGFLTQVLLSASNVVLGDYNDLVIDSAFLNFAYNGCYGDLNEFNQVSVTALGNGVMNWGGLLKDSAYYSNYDAWDTATGEWAESFVIDDIDADNSILKIKLHNNPFVSDFVKWGISNGENYFVDNETFLSYFLGFYVYANPASISETETFLYLNPTSSNSEFIIYYHNINDEDSVLMLGFTMSQDAARINLFNEKDMTQLVFGADTLHNTYVQSMAGYKTVIEVQNLDSIKNTLKGKAINRVNLSFEIDVSDTANYSPHKRMYLVRVDEDGKDFFLTDYILEGEDHFGGFLENGEYTFNITRYFHQLLTNPDFTNKLYLVASGGAVNANRTILPKEKVRFNIIYTDL